MHLKCLTFIPLIFLLAFTSESGAQIAYKVLDKMGNEFTFSEMTEKLDRTDVILFGEIHNQPISHWLSLELIEKIFAKDSLVQLGMEMFERDQQEVIDEMYAGIFPVSKLKQYTRTWNNYDTDYEPLVQYCHQNGIPLIATNIPRQYASFVFSHGLDSLYKQNIPSHLIPLPGYPIDTGLTSYGEILEMASQMGHGGGHLLDAQAVKDMTMAESIHQQIAENSRKFIHINGVFHSKYKEGIAWYLNHLNKELNISVISCHEVVDLENFNIPEHDKADFHLLINNKITKSYE